MIEHLLALRKGWVFLTIIQRNKVLKWLSTFLHWEKGEYSWLLLSAIRCLNGWAPSCTETKRELFWITQCNKAHNSFNTFLHTGKKENYSGLHSATRCTTALTPFCSKHTFQGKSNTLAPYCAGAKLVLTPSCAKVTNTNTKSTTFIEFDFVLVLVFILILALVWPVLGRIPICHQYQYNFYEVIVASIQHFFIHVLSCPFFLKHEL